MSLSRTADGQTSLFWDHQGRRDAAAVEELTRWLVSPAAFRLTLMRSPETPHSLATCEKVSRSEQTATGDGDEPTPGGDPLGHVPDEGGARLTEVDVASAAEAADVSPAYLARQLEHQPGSAASAILAATSRSRDRQAKVVECIRQGEVAHAERLAKCQRQSVELECGGWEGCGTRNYVPITCDSRICEECGKRQMGQVIGRYVDRVRSWAHATHIRLSLPERVAPDAGSVTEAVDRLRRAFSNLRSRRIQPSGEHQGKRWVWSIGDDGGEPADVYWKPELVRTVGRDRVAQLEARYVRRGRGIPVKELLVEGIYGIDIKQDPDDRTLNVHLHILVDQPYLPQPALAEAWDDLVGAPVVDVRRIYDRGKNSESDALAEVVGYAAKAPEYESVQDEVAYLRALKGSPMVQPFGDLHGNTPEDQAALKCVGCERSPAVDWDVEWTYHGVVDGQFGPGGADGDRPPPDGGGRSGKNSSTSSDAVTQNA